MSESRREWLNCVGTSYYTQEDFIREGMRIGFSRAVSLRAFGSFKWGDVIWFCQAGQKKKNRKTLLPPTKVFGYGIVDKIGGLSPDLVKSFGNDIDIVPESDEIVERNCGEYEVAFTATFKTPTTIKQIADRVKERGLDERILLQGPFVPLDTPFYLSDIHFFWGWREFDGFDAMVKASSSPKQVVSGEFRKSSSTPPETPSLVYLEAVVPGSYHLGGMYKHGYEALRSYEDLE